VERPTVEALAVHGLTPWPIPVPEAGAEGCGCHGPFVWDEWWDFWRHLSPYPERESRCLPHASWHRPPPPTDHGHRPAPARKDRPDDC